MIFLVNSKSPGFQDGAGQQYDCSGSGPPVRGSSAFADFHILRIHRLNGVITMLKTIRLAAGMAVVLGLPICAIGQEKQVTTDPGSPKLTMESVVHDFGTVVAGTPLTYSFKVKNEGTADLLIKNVAPS
jgi:hypothetical protein